jgi:hypothetical protein
MGILLPWKSIQAPASFFQTLNTAKRSISNQTQGTKWSDLYGDGICCRYGAGFFQLIAGPNLERKHAPVK